MSDHIIVAPHADDEIIGCHEVITNPDLKPIIIYTEDMDEERKEETLTLRDHCELKVQLYLKQVPPNLLDPAMNNTYYFPHPIYETHPAHRLNGIVGESMARNGFKVIFYSTEMNVPFKYECRRPKGKLQLMNDVYPSQQSLWKHDHKYWLFSGYDRWVIL